MAWNLDLSNYYAAFPNLETVTVLNLDLSVLDASVAGAKRLCEDVHQIEPSHGGYLGFELDFKLPHANVTGEIVPGCIIVDALSVRHVVLKVDTPGPMNNVWRCHCLALMTFQDEVDWRQVVQTTNDFADRITDPATYTLGGHYNCRIQPVTTDITDILGKRGLTNRFKVFMLDEPALSFGDLFIDQVGQKYKILSWENRETLETCFIVHCEVLP